ncbi:MAG: LCP family protein [Candidatus Saccharimonadales bacterium]
MQRKQTPFQSIDGFMPRNNAPRRVGFDAPRKSPMMNGPKKPETNAAVPKVGQTLSSYSPSGSMVADRRLPPVGGRKPLSITLTDDETPAKGRGKTGKKRRLLPKFVTWRKALLTFCIIVLAIGGWLGFKFAYNAAKTFHGGLFSVLSSTKLKGEDVGRVNILVAGNSADDTGHDGAQLTDSIMILSLDTKNKTAYMMSVPRDLYVDIPGYGHAKINEAYVDGENEKFNESGYFPGGMGLLQQVIEQNFDINMNYYALVNYTALKDMVDAVGGIDITVKSTDPRGLYDPSIDWTTRGPLVKLSNGVHHLNGQQALDLSRARGDAYGSYGFPASDFDRTNNQRQELVALKAKVTTTGVLANPAKLSSIFDAIGTNVKTDFTLGEVRRAYAIGKDVSSIQSIGLNNVHGKNLLTSYTTPLGQSALIPAAGMDDFSDIQAAIKQLTSTNPITREGANVVVLNATNTSGVAANAAKYLKSKGVLVSDTGDATTPQTTSTIIDVSGGKMPSTKALLQSTYGTSVVTSSSYTDIYYDADFIVLVGADHTTPPSSTKTSSQSAN